MENPPVATFESLEAIARKAIDGRPTAKPAISGGTGGLFWGSDATKRDGVRILTHGGP